MRFRIPVVLALSAMAAGCLDTAEIDENETEANLVTEPEIQDFDPGHSIIPFPNILLLSPTTGLNTLPATCGESAGGAALRTGTLNQLDGVGTWLPAIYATFSDQVDLASTEGHVFLMKQVADASTAKTVPALVQRFQTLRYEESLPVCGAANVVEGVVIVPRVPLDDNAVYTVAIIQGVTSVNGDEFQPSSGWFFSRQTTAPVSIFDRDADGVLTQADVVYNNTPLDPFDPRDENGNGIADTIEQIAGIQQLFQLNQAFLPFVDEALDTVTGTEINREDILISWAFKTQTVEKPVDPAAAVGPATHVGTGADTAVAALGPVASGGAVTPFIESRLGTGVCSQLPCAAVGAVYAGAFAAQNYQVPGPNTGTESGNVPDAWANPLNPAEATGPVNLSVLAVKPAAAQPAGGYPVVIFGHGLTRSRGDLLAVASQLAFAGIASVAIDWPLHGDPSTGGRAVQIYPTGSACQSPGDTGLPDPTLSPACFAPILTANLAGTRDNVRQGAIDILRLIAVLKANCAATSTSGGATCNGLVIDSTRIGYLGMSLGTLIGQLPLATTTDIKAAVLNVPATSWITILENTDTVTIKCPLVDALINNGTLTGKLWQLPNGTFNNTDAACITPDPHQPMAIVNDPAYKQFATAARWVLDPAESVNFVDRIAAKVAGNSMSVLLQEVRDDLVLPNEATSILGQFLGFTAPVEATTPTSATFTPSAGLSAKAAWLIYSPAATAAYAHGSLLQPPASSGVPGSLGTGQMQTDAVTFLATHLQ